MVRVKISKTEIMGINIKGTTVDPISKKTIKETTVALTMIAEIFDRTLPDPMDSDTMTTTVVDTEAPKTPINPSPADSMERIVGDSEEALDLGMITTVVITIITKISTMDNDH